MARRAKWFLLPLFFGMAAFFIASVPDVGVVVVVLAFIVLPTLVWPFMKETA